MNTCTVVTSADGSLCGKAAVVNFTGRNGETFAECATHDVSAIFATCEAEEAVVEAHPKTRSTAPYLLVRGDAIVGYANSTSAAVLDRARKAGARLVVN